MQQAIRRAQRVTTIVELAGGGVWVTEQTGHITYSMDVEHVPPSWWDVAISFQPEIATVTSHTVSDQYQGMFIPDLAEWFANRQPPPTDMQCVDSPLLMLPEGGR